MNRIYIIISVFFIIITMNGMGQNKELSLDDLIPGGSTYTKFTPELPYKALWFGDKYILSEKDTMYLINPEKPTKKNVFITNDELHELLSNKEVFLNNIQFHSIDNQILASAFITDPGNNRQVFFDPKKKQIQFEIKTDNGWKNQDLCLLNKFTAFTIDNNLYIADQNGNKKTITNDSNKDITYGTEVHRNEFGINKGTFWSPKGNRLAFYRKDESMVGDYPLVDITSREATLKNIKYPMAGMNSHEVSIGIYNPISEKIIYLKTDDPKDRYFTNISWSPDEKSIFIAELNREQDTCKLMIYNAETGIREAILFKETNNKYVEPENPLIFLKKAPDNFIWQSRRDGYKHLYLYNIDGTLKKQLTSGKFEVLNVLGFDENENFIYILSTETSPIEAHIFKVNIKTGQRIRLSKEAGIHKPLLSSSGKYILDNYSNLHTPENLDLISTQNGVSNRLSEANNPFSDYQLPEITIGTIKAADNVTDLYYRLVKPLNFDPSEKYPVVVYIYGGPHNQLVRNSWLGATRGWDIYMAQKGYFIFTLDNRGSSNRGLDFENIIHRNVGLNEANDQMKGIEFLQSLSYIDKERIGIHGWSYGGFLTINLMLNYPHIFKAGVAGGPVIDWKYYEIMYGERYMDSPSDNKEGYENANLNNIAGNLQGRLLVIHGDEDPIVVWQHSLSFLRACIQAKTHPDYFVYPGHKHNILGPDRVHLYEKVTRYFDDFLKQYHN